jgi:hypothetical protein
MMEPPCPLYMQTLSLLTEPLSSERSNMQNVTRALAWSGAAVCTQRGAEEW